MPVTCDRPDCGLSPGDKFCMTCGKAAADLPLPGIVIEQAKPLAAALSDFGTGATEQNVVYLGHRLMYTREVEEMDPVRNIRVPAQLALQLLLFVLGPLILGGLLLLVAMVCWLINQIAKNPLTQAIGAIALIGTALAYLAAAVCAVVGWFRKVPIRNAEWIMYLDDKGPAAPAVFAHIANALQRRRTPADRIRVKRVPLPGGGHRDMLELSYRRVFIGYITAYEFGSDLHIGWTFTWQLSCFQFFLRQIGMLLNGVRGQETEVHILARFEPAKTMREALHAAAREGVDVAGSATGLAVAMPSNVPVDALAGFAQDGNGLFAS